MSAAGARPGVPVIDFQQLSHDRNVAAANRAIAAMRRGETLRLQYQAGRPHWRLSRWPGSSQRRRRLINSNVSVVPVDNALFAEMPGQSWRLK